MSNLNGITIQKGKLGVSRRNNKRSVSALIISSAVLAELAYNTPITIYSTEDLEQYGLTTEFDTTNKLRAGKID